MRRFDTLFARLLLAQAITAVTLVTLFGVLFYVERNRTVARLVAERWAPALRAAAGAPVTGPLPTQPIRRATELPSLAIRSPAGAPRIVALREALRARGVPLRDVAFSPGEDNPIVWIAVPGPGDKEQWLGFVDELVEPQLPQRFVLAVLLGILLVAGISWAVAHRLVQPLATLRARLEAHAPGDDPQPEPALAIGATAEITAIDTAWSKMRARLARHERERKLLLAGVSHDLRSPLARIRIAAELLPDAPSVTPRREAIVRNVDVADRLVQSFVDHVRAGQTPLDETVDLAALARAVVAGLARSTDELQLSTPPALPLPRANRLLLERVLLNLIDNAFKHGKPPVRLRLDGQEHAVHIDVEDAGRGIAPDKRAHMLQAFARGDDSRGSPGTGLGLAVVGQVAARLGGSVSFDAQASGHRVRVALPRQGP